jgi:hypothetical protein
MNVEEPPADQSVAALFGPSGGLGQVRVREDLAEADLIPITYNNPTLAASSK